MKLRFVSLLKHISLTCLMFLFSSPSIAQGYDCTLKGVSFKDMTLLQATSLMKSGASCNDLRYKSPSTGSGMSTSSVTPRNPEKQQIDEYQECMVQLASRKTFKETADFIKSLKPNLLEFMQVWEAPNKWYVVTLSHTYKRIGEENIKTLVRQGYIPEDAFCNTSETLFETELDIGIAAYHRELGSPKLEVLLGNVVAPSEATTRAQRTSRQSPSTSQTTSSTSSKPDKGNSQTHCGPGDYTLDVGAYIMNQISGTRIAIEAEGRNVCSEGVPTGRDESSDRVAVEMEDTILCLQYSKEARIAGSEIKRANYYFSGKFLKLQDNIIFLENCLFIDPYK